MSSSIPLKIISPPMCVNSPNRSCTECSKPTDRIESAIELVRREYESGIEPWYLGFSGGKDSSALVKVVCSALQRTNRRDRIITIVYCDTRVEIPLMAQHVRRTLLGMIREARTVGLPIRVVKAAPAVKESFFVKVIGRGYPPPTNKFRWCTDRLRIEPVRRVIAQRRGGKALVLLGTRRGESAERDRTLITHKLEGDYFYKQSGDARITIFAPLVDFSLSDVWSAVQSLALPRTIDTGALWRLYRDSGAECPIVRNSAGTPCGAGRFGCWTCTVVRQDKAVASMVVKGHSELAPLHEFRNWLAKMRDELKNRCRYRRNGRKGLGPLTLAARKETLCRLRKIERAVPWKLITRGEIDEIHRLWALDRRSSKYRE